MQQQVDELNELKRQIENKKMQFKQLNKHKSVSTISNNKTGDLNSTRKNNIKENQNNKKAK
jgi:hypothetical protein